MTTPLSLATRLVRLTATRDHMDVGGAAIQFYTGTHLPATPETVTTETLLGIVPLATPCGVVSSDGNLALLTITTPQSAMILATGLVGWVRFVDGDGEGILDCKAYAVGDNAPGYGVVDVGAVGIIVLSSTQVYAGGEMQLLSCVFTE